MIYMVWATALVALTQFASDIYRRFDRDVEEGGVHERRMIAWGTVRSRSKMPEHDFRYFFFVVPYARSWELDYSRDNFFCWHEFVVRKFAGKWDSYWMPVRT